MALIKLILNKYVLWPDWELVPVFPMDRPKQNDWMTQVWVENEFLVAFRLRITDGLDRVLILRGSVDSMKETALTDDYGI